MSKNKAPKMSLSLPEGVYVKRYNVGGQVRFTAPTLLGYEKLIAIAVGDKFLWICKGFSA